VFVKRNATDETEIPEKGETAPHGKTRTSDFEQIQVVPTRSPNEVPPLPLSGSTMPQRNPEPPHQARSVSGRMIVGPGIKLKSEISDCDTLVVEGTADGTLTSEVLAISEGGIFAGTAKVTDAEIYGRFVGELTVKGVLHIRSGGHVEGTVEYGCIEVESGGEIAGMISREDAAAASTNPANTEPAGVSRST